MAEFIWIGHAAFKIKNCDGKIIYFDPWINNNPVTNENTSGINNADIIFVTHGHIDHFGDSIEILKKTQAILVSTPEICNFCKKEGISEEKLYPMHIGGVSEIKGIKTRIVYANHMAEIYYSGKVFPGAGCIGFILEIEQGVKVYFSGDTGIFGDMKIYASLYKPNIVIFPIGGRYTMDPFEASVACSWIEPDYIIPIHYNAFLIKDKVKKNLKN